MHQSLTCGLVFHANQYSAEDCYDDEENTVAPATSTQMTTEVSIPEPGREGGEIGSLQDEGLYI